MWLMSDSTVGCDAEHDYPSKAVWKALGVPQSECGGLTVYWSD
jgi:hypothetical protein